MYAFSKLPYNALTVEVAVLGISIRAPGDNSRFVGFTSTIRIGEGRPVIAENMQVIGLVPSEVVGLQMSTRSMGCRKR
jgi:hypothetical protein